MNRMLRRLASPRTCTHVLGSLLAWLLVSSPAPGATLTWTNPRGGAWSTTTNWNPARLPTVADDVIIDLAGSYAITQSAAGLAHHLTLGGPPGSEPILLSRAALGATGTLRIAPSAVLRSTVGLTGAVVRVEGRLDWNGGTLSAPAGTTGRVEVAAGGVLALTNNSVRTLVRQAVTNAGTIHWSQGNLNSSGGAAEIWNSGAIDDASALPAPAATALSLGAVLHHLPAGSLVLTNTVLSLAQGGETAGSITVLPPASLRITSTTQPFEITRDARFAGTGQLRVAGWLRLPANSTPAALPLPLQIASGQVVLHAGSRVLVDRLELVGGFLAGPGEMTVSGSTLWLGGDLRSNLVLNCDGGLRLTNTATHPFSSGRVRNGGVAEWRGATLQTTPGPAVISNALTGSFVVGDGARWLASGTSRISFDNAGRFTNVAGATAVTIEGDFHNAGPALIQGTLALDPTSGRYRQRGGLTQLDGGTLRAPAGFEFESTLIHGTGVLDGNVTNHGALRLRSDPGLVRVTGDFTLGGPGALEVELPAQPSDPFVRLQVDGIARLDGTVLALTPAGFAPPPGAAFTFLTSSHRLIGRFADFSEAPTPPDLRLRELESAAAIEVAPPSELALWLGDASLTDRGLLLTAEERVSLPLTVSLAGGDPGTVRVSASAADPTLVPPTRLSPSGTGRNRTLTILPGFTNVGATTISVVAEGPGGQRAALTIPLRIISASTQGLIAWEPFDYPDGVSLANQRGGFGFVGGWAQAAGYTNRPLSLEFPALRSTGGHVVARAGRTAITQVRTLPRPLGTVGTTRYLGFVARADAPVVPGTANDYFGLLLQGSEDGGLFIGKPGGGATERWVIEDAGGARQAASVIPVVSGTPTLLVVRIDFGETADRVALYINPVPGQPESFTPYAVRTDRFAGPVTSLAFTSTGAWSTDELRIGTTWRSAVPAPDELPALGILPIPEVTVGEGGRLTYSVQLTEEIAPRERHFALAAPPGGSLPAGLFIAEATGALDWFPGESFGGTTVDVLVRVHDTPEPPSRSAEAPLRIQVLESNQPPELVHPGGDSLAVHPGFPVQLTLEASDPDLPRNPVTFAKVSGPDDLVVDPGGAVSWTPPGTFPLGPTNLVVRLTDLNQAAPAATRSLSVVRTVTLDVREPLADPAIELTSAPTETRVNEETDFVVTVRNRGYATATGVQLRLTLPELATLPPYARLASLTLSQGTSSAAGMQVVCALGDLPPGGSAIATFRLVFDLDGSQGPDWEITAAGRDGDPANNRVQTNLRVFPALLPVPANPLVWHSRSARFAGPQRYVRMASNSRGQPHLLGNLDDSTSLHSTWNGLAWSQEYVPRGYPMAYRLFTDTSSAAEQLEGLNSYLRWSEGDLDLAGAFETTNTLSRAFFIRDGIFADPDGSWVLVGLSGYSLDGFRGRIPFALAAPAVGGHPAAVWTPRPARPVDAGTHDIDFRAGVAIDSSQFVGQVYDETDNRTVFVLCNSIPPDLNHLDEIESFAGGRTSLDSLVTATRLRSGIAACYTDLDLRLRFARKIEGRWEVETVDGLNVAGLRALKLVGDASDTPTLAACVATPCGAGVPTPDCPDRKVWWLGRRLSAGWTWTELYRSEISGSLLYGEADSLDLDLEAVGPEIRVALTTGYPHYDLKWLRLAPKWELFPDVAPALPETQPRIAEELDGTIFVASRGSPNTGDSGLHMNRFDGSATGLVRTEDEALDLFATPSSLTLHAWDGVGAIAAAPSAWVNETRLHVYRSASPLQPWESHPSRSDSLDKSLPMGLLRFGLNDFALVGFGTDHRLLADMAPLSAPTPLTTKVSAAAPALSTAPAAVAYCEVNDGAASPGLYAVYHTGPPAEELRVAQFDGRNWVGDRFLARFDIASTPHGGPGLLAAHWGLNAPFDDDANRGVLYAAYTARAADGTVSLRIGSLDLGNALATWRETIPTHQPVLPYGLQSLSLSGHRESLKIAFTDRLLYLLHADRISDPANVEAATLETLPTPAPAANVEVHYRGESTWLAFVRSNRVQVLAAGILREDPGLDSTTGLPWRPAIVPDSGDSSLCAASTLWTLANIPTDPRGAGVFKPYPPESPASTPALRSLASSPAGGNTATTTPLRRTLADPRFGTLRHARDLMLGTDEGRRLEALYRRFSPEVRRRIFADPEILRSGISLLLHFLPNVNAWVEGRGAGSTVTPALVSTLDRFWLLLSEGATSELRAALLSERDRFHAFRDFAGKSMDEWASLLRLPATGRAAPRIIDTRLEAAGLTVTLEGAVPGTFQLWRTDTLVGAPWRLVDDAVAGTTDGHPSLTDPHPPATAGFYRIASPPPASPSGTPRRPR
jgi:hypothetical protein